MTQSPCTQDTVRGVITDATKRVGDAKKAVEKALATLIQPEALDDIMRALEQLRVNLTGEYPCGEVEPNDLMPEAFELRRAIEKDLAAPLALLHDRIHRVLASAKVTGDSARGVHRKLLDSADAELAQAEKTAALPTPISGPAVAPTGGQGDAQPTG